jgi:predicted MFS family arabinose efflux permease
MAIYNMVLNVGMLAGSLVGPMVLAALGLQETLFLGAAVRLTSAFLFAVLV